MNGKTVSILMSVYCREHPQYFRRALESLAQQTSPADEIVVVCDGPLGPHLESVIEDFEAFMPMKVVRLPENVGLAAALNAGLQHCKSEWVARFDSDDISEADRLEIQRGYIADNPIVDVVGSNIAEFDVQEDAPYALRNVPPEHNDIVNMAKRRNPMNHMTVMFRKSAVMAVGGYPADHLYEDYSLWVNLIVAGYRFGNIDKPLVRARAGAAQAVRRGGIGYVRGEVGAQIRFWRVGFISAPQLLFNVLVRTTVRLAPSSLRARIYRKALRRSVHAGVSLRIK